MGTSIGASLHPPFGTACAAWCPGLVRSAICPANPNRTCSKSGTQRSWNAPARRARSCRPTRTAWWSPVAVRLCGYLSSSAKAAGASPCRISSPGTHCDPAKNWAEDSVFPPPPVRNVNVICPYAQGVHKGCTRDPHARWSEPPGEWATGWPGLSPGGHVMHHPSRLTSPFPPPPILLPCLHGHQICQAEQDDL